MSAFIDTDIIVRHLTGDPPAMAERATRFLANEVDLLLADVIVAETIYVLESFYEAPRGQVAEAVRSLISFDSIRLSEPPRRVDADAFGPMARPNSEQSATR